MTIKEVIARENVIITLDDGTEMDSEKLRKNCCLFFQKETQLKI